MPRLYDVELPEVRFWRFVNKNGPIHPTCGQCWVWEGGLSGPNRNYGVFMVGAGNAKRAHRFSFALTYGEISDDVLVLHKCDNPSCVNPEHLFLGTYKDNYWDMVSKNRQPLSDTLASKGEDNPKAKLTEDQVREIRQLKGKTPSRKVARMYGLKDKTAVLRIWSGFRWGHVQ